VNTVFRTSHDAARQATPRAVRTGGFWCTRKLTSTTVATVPTEMPRSVRSRTARDPSSRAASQLVSAASSRQTGGVPARKTAAVTTHASRPAVPHPSAGAVATPASAPAAGETARWVPAAARCHRPSRPVAPGGRPAGDAGVDVEREPATAAP
jgi:hypothetical protein